MLEETERKAAALNRRDLSLAEKKWRAMSGVTDLDDPVCASERACQRGVLRREPALAQEAVCPFDQLLDRNFRLNQGAKESIQTRHEQRSGDTLPRHVADSQKELTTVALAC